MTNKYFRNLLRFCAALTLCASVAMADSTPSLEARLQQASNKSSLDDASLKPWHLKMTYHIFDAKGVASEQGTIEEWWQDPETHKTVYTGAPYAGVEIQAKGKLYRTKGMPIPPLLVDAMLAGVVHPLPNPNDISGTKPVLYSESAGKIKLDCIVLNGAVKGFVQSTLGMFPSYCLARSGDTLLMVYDYGTQMTIRNRFGTFQGRDVAVDQITAVNGVKAASAHVETLDAVSVSEADFTPSSDMETVEKAVDVKSGVIKDYAIRKISPVFPKRAREHHAFGTVVIDVVIGQDGHIDKMKLVQAPDPDLATSALAAVRQWAFRPYLVSGHPVAIHTTIKVNYDYQ